MHKCFNMTREDDDGNEIEVEFKFPAKFAVCSDCEGHGSVLNESMRYHAYTSEEFGDFDDEEREQYFKRGGMYDVECPTCHGERVELVIDYEAVGRSEKLTKELAEWEEYEADWEAGEADYRAECEMERRMGC